jgi:hypothetical protein
LEVYPYERWSDRSLPQLNEGQRFIVRNWCKIPNIAIKYQISYLF